MKPLILRTYCSAAARTSSSVAAGSKLYSVRMLRHMPFTVPDQPPSTGIRAPVRPARRRGEQPGDGVGDRLGRHRAAGERLQLPQAAGDPLVADRAARHRRVDEAGLDEVHADALGRALERRGAHEPAQAGLAGRVGGGEEVGVGVGGEDRPDRDERAAAAAAEGRERRAQEPEGGLEVDEEDLGPALVAAGADRAVAERAPAHPDRVHDAREGPEPLGLLDGALGAAGARDVDAVAVHGDHAVAVRLEPLDARAADTAGRPGHEDVHPGNLAQPQPNVRVATPRVW